MFTYLYQFDCEANHSAY